MARHRCEAGCALARVQAPLYRRATMPVESHPSLRARLARSLRFASGVKGHWRVANALAGQPHDPRFRVCGPDGWMEGALDSVIERQAYLLGGYEAGLIAAFLSLFPPERRGWAIDVGANVGTHSLAFARHFERVVAFEPYRPVFAKLTRNLALNPGASVTPIACGLGDVAATRPFFNIFNGNDGLGTFLEGKTYDRPLEKIADFPIVRGDDALADLLTEGARVDAIKLDIQGYEPRALKGLQNTLARHRPIVWAEFARGRHGAFAPGEAFAELFPYPVEIFAFRVTRRLGIARVALEQLDSVSDVVGDVVVRPV